MKFKILTTNFRSALLLLFFIVGLQNFGTAQMTIKNGSQCTIIVLVAQNDYTTPPPCDLCPVNPPQFVTILPNTKATIFGQDVCDEQWGWVAWTTNFTSWGISFNPALGGACGNDAFGPTCAGQLVTTGSWFSTNANGTGPAAVVIQ